jgi:uncharacterized sodium:solute symporter family permease YidK
MVNPGGNFLVFIQPNEVFMNIAPQDLVVFVGFFVLVVGLCVWKSRKIKGHEEDSSDFFLAGRGLTWPLIGISIVAANISTEQMVGMAGQAAGSTGLAVSCWQLLGSVFIVIISMTLLPKFLRAGIYTMPEYLEYRYNKAARGIMACLTVVPFAMVMPGLRAQQLYGGELGAKTDAAFPTMVTKLIAPGVRGFIYAAIAGAVTSTLASLLNPASTISTMDVYRRMLSQNASQEKLVWLGRGLTLAFVIAGCSIAPMLDDPKFGGVFQYIQQFQGYIWPGVVAAFIMPFVLPKVPGAAGVVALVTGPIAYAAFQFTTKADTRPWGNEIHFLLQVLFAFLVVAALMTAMTLVSPLAKAKVLPVRGEINLVTEPIVKVAGGMVILGVVIFFIIFW